MNWSSLSGSVFVVVVVVLIGGAGVGFVAAAVADRFKVPRSVIDCSFITFVVVIDLFVSLIWERLADFPLTIVAIVLNAGAIVFIAFNNLIKAFRTPHEVSLFMLLYQLGGLIGIFACTYATIGIIDADKQVTHNFGNCLYFSVVTLTTVGYGDFTPTPLARPVAAVQALSGYMFLALLISVMTNRLATKE